MKQITFLLLISALHLCVCAQDTSLMRRVYVQKADSSILNSFNLDFAVPDIPAFKALGNDPSNLLRPSSVKDFALMLGNFREGGSFTIPQNLAVELTPGLLVKPSYTLNEYQASGGIRFLTKLRLSAGSNRDEVTSTNSLAFGLRATVFDKGDFRLSQAFLDTAVYRYQDGYTQAWSRNVDAINKARFRTMEEAANATRTTRDSVIEAARVLTIAEIGFDLDEIVADALADFKQKEWNASRMDFAYSIVLQSPNELLGKAAVERHLFWFVWALRPGSQNRWGQLVLGVSNAAAKAGDGFDNAFTGNLRFYAGRNRLKGFFEGQYKNFSYDVPGGREQLFAQVGVEVAVYKSIWVHFGTGLLNALDGSARSQLLSNINLYFAFPEQLQLFRR